MFNFYIKKAQITIITENFLRVKKNLKNVLS